MSEFVYEAPYVDNVEVYVMREVSADVGVGVHQGAVQRCPAHADHHGNQAQQQQDQTWVSAHLIVV